jgi:hypothetical protein
MVTIVSETVPINVVMHDILKSLRRNSCDVGYTRYRIMEICGRNSETMSNAPVECQLLCMKVGFVHKLKGIRSWGTLEAYDARNRKTHPRRYTE